MSLLPEISQASAEINKLVAQANIHQTIAPVDPAAFTYPADTALLASRDPVIREVSVGMTGDAYSDYSVSGTPPLSLPNSLGKPLKVWSVELSPYQDGSGDPSPSNVRPIHGTDKLTIYTDSKYGGLVEWNQQLYFDSESWTFNGMQCSVNNGRFTITGTATITATTSLVPSRIYNKTKPVQGHVYALILSGETNLNNLNFRIYGTPNQTVSLNPLQSVIFTCNSANVADAEFVAQYNSGEEYNTDITAYLCDLTQMFGAGNEPSTIADFLAMFEKPYYPYSTGGTLMTVDQVNGAQYSPAVLTLPQTVYTGTIGSEGGESRQVKMVLNGSENWTGSNTNGIYMQLNDMKKLTSYTANNSILCENLSVVSNNGNLTDFSITGYVDWANRYPTNNWLYIRIDGEHPDVTSVKEWLAEHPVTIVYELATPTTFAVPSPTIPTPTGTATTWATAEDGTVDSMEVTYIKSE